MPKPSDVFDYATDANFPAGTDPWSATPTRVAPSGGAIDSGVIPGDHEPAQHFNYLVGVLSDWITWLDFITGTQIKSVPLMAANLISGTPVSTSAGQISAVDPDIIVPLYGFTVGQKITAIRARIKDSSVSPEKFFLTLVTYTDGTPAFSSSSLSTGSGSVQTLLLTVTAAIEPGKVYAVRLEKDAAMGDTLDLYSIEVDYDSADM